MPGTGVIQPFKHVGDGGPLGSVVVVVATVVVVTAVVVVDGAAVVVVITAVVDGATAVVVVTAALVDGAAAVVVVTAAVVVVVDPVPGPHAAARTLNATTTSPTLRSLPISTSTARLLLDPLTPEDLRSAIR